MSETTAIAYGTAIAVSIALMPYVFVISRRWLMRRRHKRKTRRSATHTASQSDR